MNDTNKKIARMLYRLAQILETLVGAVLVVAICAALFSVMEEAGLLWKSAGNSHIFHDFLASAFTVVIGVEFLKMLCRHSMRSVIEVVLFATARKMVVEHVGAMETLLMVIAMAILFLIRKYLFIAALDEDEADHPCSQSQEEQGQQRK